MADGSSGQKQILVAGCCLIAIKKRYVLVHVIRKQNAETEEKKKKEYQVADTCYSYVG